MEAYDFWSIVACMFKSRMKTMSKKFSIGETTDIDINTRIHPEDVKRKGTSVHVISLYFNCKQCKTSNQSLQLRAFGHVGHLQFGTKGFHKLLLQNDQE